MMPSFGVIRRNAESAGEVQDILGLPDDRWSDVQVEFGTDNVATAKVTILLTADQLVALAYAAIPPHLRGS